MRSSLILVFFLFGLALCAPKFYSSELEGLSDVQQQQQQEQPQQQGEEKVQLEETERRRLSERLGRRVESDEPTPRQEAIVILRPTVAARQTAARFAVRRVKLVPIPVVAVPAQQQQQQQESSEEEETTPETTPEPTTPSTTTEEETTTSAPTEETTSDTEEPSTTEETNTAADEEQRPKFASDASAVVNSRTFTTFKARKNVNGKQVTVMGRSMALRSSFMNVLRPVVAQPKENETDEERQQREKAEADAKNVKIVQFSSMQAIRSSKAVITRDLQINF